MSYASFLPLLLTAHAAPISDLGNTFSKASEISSLQQVRPGACNIKMSSETNTMNCQVAYLAQYKTGVTSISYEAESSVFTFIGKREGSQLRVMRIMLSTKSDGNTISAYVPGACDIQDDSIVCAADVSNNEISGDISGKTETLK